MSNNQIPSAAKDIFSAPGVYIEDVNMTMDFFTVDFPASAHMQAGVTPQCANYVPTNTAVSVAGNSQTAHNRITESCSHTAPVMQVKQVKAEVADSCSFPAGYNVNSVNTAVKYELGAAVPNNNDPYASLMTLFSPGQVDSIFNKLALSTEDFKCFRCSVKSNYDGAGNDLFNLKLAMCMNPSGGFCCPICDTKFRLPTPLEHHLNMHCLTGNGVSVRCVTCRDEFHVLIPGKKGETGDSLKKTTSLKQNNSIQEQSTSTDRNSSAESEDTQQWTKTSRGKNRKTKNLTDQSFVSLGYSKDCQVCGKHFGRHESLIVHMRTHTGEKPYVCQTCGKAFATSSHCRSHQAVHNANLRPQCKVCGKTLSRKEALKRHMRIHSGEKPYSCGQCDKKFRSHSDLRAHQIVHHGAAADKALACPVCGKNFNRKDTLTVHLRSHTGERPHGCDVCGKRFVTKSHLKSHQLTHSDIRDVPCPVCKKMFSRKETMKKHLQRHTDYHPFLCDTCGKAFFENKDLQEHLLTHGDKRWIHMCQMCGNAFTRRDSLAAHMQDHINEKLFKCDYCMKGFSKLQHLREHIRSTHRRSIKGKKFPCPVCSKLFLVKSHVNDHMKSHGNDKCFKCNTCGKYFIHQPHLVAHASVHMGTKRNQCRICGKAFRFWSNLKTHMCKHLGVRPYCCRYCTRTFIHKLKEHIQVHVGAKPYSCSVCAKDFHRKESRDYHMYKHTGVKPYLCEVCMKSFGNTHQMLRHKLVHKVKNTQFLSKILSGKKLRRVKRTRLMPPSEELTTVVSGQNAQNVVEVQLPVEASPVMVAGCNMVPSGQMMMFLHNQLQTALSSNLCSQDSGKSTTVQNIDQNKDIGEPVAMQKDHMLLTLTIVNNFIKSHIDDVTKTMREQNTASVLLGIMRNGDMFISRTASQCLISWLNECQQQDEWIPVVVDIITSLVNINTSYQGLVSSLDVLKRMFVEPKPGGPCAAGQIVEKRRLISSHLIAQCSALIHRFLHYTDRDQSSVLMYNLLSLWNKILKFHLKTSHLQNENEILYINHLLTESLCRGDVAPMCISKALASLNCCLPRSADFTTAYEMPKFHIELASRLMLSIECLLEMLPWVIGDEVFGCKLYRKYELQQCTDITVHLSTCALRKLVILTLKSVAVLVHAEFKAPGPGLVTVLSTLLSMVNKLQSVSHANKGRLGISLSWLFDCCGDQDDAMIDALLSLLHIILLLQKSCVVQLEVTHQLCSRFEPHLLFFVFIAAHASWDDSMLFDLLTSPETAILTYLVKYLHYVLQDWDRFVAACRHFSREYPLLLLSDTASSSSEAVGASSVATSCLEKTMTFLIRLRIKIERAQSRGLIAYNCEPLLKLFKQCEMLYER